MDLITGSRKSGTEFDVRVRGHVVRTSLAGGEGGITPAELLAGSLGACVAMVLQVNAGKFVELAYDVVAGLLWVLPARWLISWMSVRFSVVKFPSTNSYTLSSVTSDPMGLDFMSVRSDTSIS